jgi:heme A synthase
VSASDATVHPVIRKLATTTCVVALLPIGMGALVTTLKAGMAFADWPSSDGHNMLLYPWFRDFATNPDKFTEHGHRLAGMLIGFISIALAAAAWRQGQGWVRTFASTILAAVILQGLLGGARVLFDRQHLAMVHSITGASFFCLCVIFRLMCSTKWPEWLSQRDERLTPGRCGLCCAGSSGCSRSVWAWWIAASSAHDVERAYYRSCVRDCWYALELRFVCCVAKVRCCGSRVLESQRLCWCNCLLGRVRT